MRKAVRDGKKVVGYVEDGTLYQVLRPEHLLRTPPAVAKSEAVLRSAEALGAVRYQATRTDTGDVLTASLAAFWGPHSLKFNRGHGPQRALPLGAFFVVSVSQPTLPLDWSSVIDDGRNAFDGDTE